ncbi:RNA binding motif protein 12B gene 2 isoform X1 [Xenopus tropicalis]|uniref:RNA binding motif protein 12B gene 2 n=1 Tax=Xenopus tropicalis TaxID=8364 RepID=F7DVC0_XENTR|nr:RNA binding motif protein 12B gene 2 isoform X1 [Xenopus tropicalis]
MRSSLARLKLVSPPLRAGRKRADVGGLSALYPQFGWLIPGLEALIGGKFFSGPKMSVVIKLQGLSIEANSIDIRQFFSNLDIPKGYIYITGGKYGEAFIIFSSYEDARRAISYSGRPLKNSSVHLSISSQAEMQRALEEINSRFSSVNSASGNGTPSYKETSYFRKPDTLYVYVHGMPLNTTKVEIKSFFVGLTVEDAIFLKYPSGLRNGNAIVKFTTSGDAHEAVKRSGQQMGSTPVSLMLSDEAEWIKVGGVRARKRELSPEVSFDDRKKSVPHSRHELIKTRARSPYEERFVHLINLPYDVSKRDIKVHFGNLAMKDSQITFLCDWSGKRTREGFVKFTSINQYRDACAQHRKEFCSRLVDVLPISERDMMDLIARTGKKPRERSLRKDSPKKCSQESNLGKGKCIYLRNFASNVTKPDIQNFFSGFSLKEEDIFLLYDNNGIGLGEALVVFSTEKEAESTKKLHCKKFQGTEILLSCINEQQMKAFGVNTSARQSEAKIQEQAPEYKARAPARETHLPVTEVGASVNMKCEHLDLPVKLQSSKLPVAYETLQSLDLPFTLGSTDFPKNEDFAENALHRAVDTPSIAKDVPFIQIQVNSGSVPDSPVKDVIPNNNGNQNGVGVVLVKHLPRTFTVSEALDFFHGYKVSSVNLAQIGNGVARVRFQTHKEAVDAVKDLNNKPVGHHKVFLALV